MNAREQYDIWMASPCVDSAAKAELSNLSDDEVTDRFYRDLEFGTGGLRGVLGIGTNRLNIYTVRKATQGLANYLLKTCGSGASIAISYDSRINSDLFARETASVLVANGLTAWIYPRLEPTPALSYAVRALHCKAGVCVTASHNPPQYNGYKVYEEHGCQITLEAANAVLSEIEQLDIFRDVKYRHFSDGVASGKICYIPESVLTNFVDEVLTLRVAPAPYEDFEVVFTPLNGTGLECIRGLFGKLGIPNVTVVPQQEQPDGHFPTCPFPNPEEPAALQLGLELCREKRADLLLGTDPDCDRLGIAVFDGTDYRLLSGNEVGILLLDYICRVRQVDGTLRADNVAITTIVSTKMADAVAEKYGIELKRVITGFKFIGEQINALEEKGQANRFLFGFEESYGYLSGSHVRDKDAVNAAMLVCEMANYYKRSGSSVYQALESLYREFGCYHDRLCSFSFPGAAGASHMAELMTDLRMHPVTEIGGTAVVRHVDYQNDETGLPKSNVLEYHLANGSRVTIRPSGTEPKVKAYISTKADRREAAQTLSAQLADAMKQILH